MVLAGLCRFIIADITNPRSSPLELQATVPEYMIPFVPIIQEAENPFAMFKNLWHKHDWVLDPLRYKNEHDLIKTIEAAVIEPAEKKHSELITRKFQELQFRSTGDYLDT